MRSVKKLWAIWATLLLFFTCKETRKIQKAWIEGVSWDLSTPVALSRDRMIYGPGFYREEVADPELLEQLESAIAQLNTPSPEQSVDYRAQIGIVYSDGDTVYLGVGRMHNVLWEGEIYSDQSGVIRFIREAVPIEKTGIIPPIIGEKAYNLLNDWMKELDQLHPSSDREKLLTGMDSLLQLLPGRNLEAEVEVDCRESLEDMMERVKNW